MSHIQTVFRTGYCAACNYRDHKMYDTYSLNKKSRSQQGKANWDSLPLNICADVKIPKGKAADRTGADIKYIQHRF